MSNGRLPVMGHKLRRDLWLHGLLLVTLAAFLGCCSKAALHPVEGKVIYKESTAGTVTFHPKDGDPVKSHVSTASPLTMDFQVSTGDKLGAPAYK